MNKNKRLKDSMLNAHSHTSDNREEIKRSNFCTCIYCQDTYPASEVVEYVDDEHTALCPHCGIDAVVGDASGINFSASFLARLYNYWFT